MKRVLAFLFESNLPVWLQVSWKLICLAQGVGLVVVAWTSVESLEGSILLSVLGSVFLLAAIFTKLGDG